MKIVETKILMKIRDKCREDFKNYDECIGDIFSRILGKELSISQGFEKFYNNAVALQLHENNNKYRRALDRIVYKDLEKELSLIIFVHDMILDISKETGENYEDDLIIESIIEFIEKQDINTGAQTVQALDSIYLSNLLERE